MANETLKTLIHRYIKAEKETEEVSHILKQKKTIQDNIAAQIIITVFGDQNKTGVKYFQVGSKKYRIEKKHTYDDTVLLQEINNTLFEKFPANAKARLKKKSPVLTHAKVDKFLSPGNQDKQTSESDLFFEDLSLIEDLIVQEAQDLPKQDKELNSDLDFS